MSKPETLALFLIFLYRVRFVTYNVKTFRRNVSTTNVKTFCRNVSTMYE
ncbi:MAG: hypothetical protein KME54_02320 [Tolypothrix brevis GSE-NOS-MK-07-07A]|nr:hypothetical protein [Tolypothrix brevis GSE-NOS-MK-07-07A]